MDGALIIVHPHYGCRDACMPYSRRFRHLKKGQEWAREDPFAERIITGYNARDIAYRIDALQARVDGKTVLMLDHNCPGAWAWDMENSLFGLVDGGSLPGLLVAEAGRLKNALTSWFADNFGSRNLLGIDHNSTGVYLRFNFPGVGTDCRIALMGEFLHCCVSDVRASLSNAGFRNVRILGDRCVDA